MADVLFTVAEAAEKLGVSPRTIQRYCKQSRMSHKWVNGKRHKELRIVPPISLDKLPGVKRRSAINAADYVTRKDFNEITARLDREILKKDIRVDELKEEIVSLRSQISNLSGEPATVSASQSGSGLMKKTAESLAHEFEKVRPAEKKLILKLVETIKKHDEFLRTMGLGKNTESE